MQQRIVKTSDPASFLRLVLVVFRGKRTCGAMRLDLPHLDGDLDRKRFTNTVIGMVCKVEGADGVVPIAYTDAPFRSAPRSLLRSVAKRARIAGLRVPDLLVVASDGWASLLEPSPPWDGHPLEAIRPRRLAGEPDLLDVAAELRLPKVGEDEVAAFDEHLLAWLDHPNGVGRRVHGVDPGRGLAGTSFGPAAVAGEPYLRRVCRGLDAGGILEGMLEEHDEEAPCPCLALLAAFAAIPMLRDLAMLQFAWGPEFGDHVRDRTLASAEDLVEADDPVTLAFSGGDMPRPDPRRIEAALRRIKRAAACLPEGERAPLFAMAAWLHWALGRGSLAGTFAERSAQDDPGYPFAGLLLTLLSAGTLPEWAFREEPLGAVGRSWLRPPA